MTAHAKELTKVDACYTSDHKNPLTADQMDELIRWYERVKPIGLKTIAARYRLSIDKAGVAFNYLKKSKGETEIDFSGVVSEYGRR